MVEMQFTKLFISVKNAFLRDSLKTLQLRKNDSVLK